MLAATQEWLSSLLGAGVMFGGIGYAVGQFFSQRRKSISDSLSTALDEVAAVSLRADRLEEEMHKQATEMAGLRQENGILRGLVTGNAPLLEALSSAKGELEALLRTEHEKTRTLIESIKAGGA